MSMPYVESEHPSSSSPLQIPLHLPQVPNSETDAPSTTLISWVPNTQDFNIAESSSSLSGSASSSRSLPFSTLHFFVCYLSRTLVIHAQPHDTVNSIIARIVKITGIPASDHHLIYRGRELDDNSTLASYHVQKDAILELTGRLRSAKYPDIWHIIDDLVSTLHSIHDNATIQIHDTKTKVIQLIHLFLSVSTTCFDEDETWDRVEVFVLGSVPAMLVKLYLSPNQEMRSLAIEAIVIFLDCSPQVLPKHIRRKCVLILLEFCKLLSGVAATTDPLYIMCRHTLAGLLMDPKLLCLSRFKSADMVGQLFPFVSELAEKVWVHFDSRDHDDFSCFLFAISHATLNSWGFSCPPPLSNINQSKNCLSSLYVIFMKFLKTMDNCLVTVGRILSRNQGIINDAMVLSFVPHALVDCYVFSRIWAGAENFLRSIMFARRSVLNLILKDANRTPNLFWILRHRDLLDSEARINLVFMMFPETEADLQVMIIDRSMLLAESFEYIARVNSPSLHGWLFIEFKNEEATGHGVLREWFCLLCRELFSPENSFFLSCPYDRRRFFPNTVSLVDPKQLEYFCFCGRVIALALRHGVQVGIAFDRVFFLQLAGRTITLGDVQYADPDFYGSCKRCLEMKADELDSDDLGLTFVREIKELGSHSTIELCPGGKDIVVNSRNNKKYVDLLIKSRFVTSVSEKVAYFAKGFGEMLIISRNPTYFFLYLGLEDFNKLLRGNDIISLTDWRAHTEYEGYTGNDSQIQWFWKIVESMSMEQQSCLLFFWTSVKYLPFDGFAGLDSKLCIYRSLDSCKNLPTSQTCFYRLCLPEYQSEAAMRNCLFLITEEHVIRSFGLQ